MRLAKAGILVLLALSRLSVDDAHADTLLTLQITSGNLFSGTPNGFPMGVVDLSVSGPGFDLGADWDDQFYAGQTFWGVVFAGLQEAVIDGGTELFISPLSLQFQVDPLPPVLNGDYLDYSARAHFTATGGGQYATAAQFAAGLNEVFWPSLSVAGEGFVTLGYHTNPAGPSPYLPSATFTFVPEPSSLALVILGLIAISVIILRGSRRIVT